MSARIDHVVVTCEHATNRVPPEVRAAFRGKSALLKSHRGWDPGALAVAERVAGAIASAMFVGEVSRLVIELNRSIDSPTLFSAVTRELDDETRAGLIRRHYTPWRAAAKAHIERLARVGVTLHLSVHSFTPVLDGKRRELEVGLLFDPARAMEKDFCARWRDELRREDASVDPWRVKMNLSYRGTSDGHTTALRAVFPPERYLGVEIEVRNDLIGARAGQERVGGAVASSLRRALGMG